MTILLNKSIHPVEVKKIKVEIWALRSEIEAAISKRLSESDSTDLKELDISDIQEFYQNQVSHTQTDTEKIEKDTNEDIAQLADDVLSEVEESSQNKEAKTFQRVRPEATKITTGEVLLSDIQMDQVMLFTEKNFLTGQNVVISFQVTKPFLVSGEIFKTVNYARNSKIIKETKLDHRLQVKFSLNLEQERSKLREFLTSIEPTINTPPKKMKKKSEEDSNDDFDGLGL